ncbi:VWA domain-containing protein [Ferrimicrobium sp.]|uniref:vWA domain-containing protein n=1 Tax=Ferrimicrobium sp. TaxID=2926050 RepID=UPI0026306F15|nr:VWA domain-containing protein [Ferrimicrobium sp.]
MKPEELVTGFVELLRVRGLRVPLSSARDFFQALEVVGISDPAYVREMARATLVKSHQDDELFNRVFDEYFFAEGVQEVVPRQVTVGFDSQEAPEGEQGIDDEVERVVRYSAAERLRRVDLRSLEPAQRREAFDLIDRFRFAPPLRRSYRLVKSHKPQRLDLAQTLRLAIGTDGEPVRRRFRSKGWRCRRLLFLVDISGSMHAYAEGLLHFAWASQRALGEVAVFTLGTRLNNITRALGANDPDRAMARVSAVVEDYAGGTRLGESLAMFNTEHGGRALARGAIVVVFSDGWDRGDPQVMEEAMARLCRLAKTILWVNPLAAAADYAPLARGMATALPYIDALLPGESVRSFEHLAKVICSEGVPTVVRATHHND